MEYSLASPDSNARVIEFSIRGVRGNSIANIFD